MSRTKLDLPEQFHFHTNIPIRITDLNYGGHVGNDAVLSLLHEARMQFLKHYHFSEMNFAGVGLIMSDVSIEFKNELFYEDDLKAYVAIKDMSKVGFSIYYKLVKNSEETVVAFAKTGMVCYDYQSKKIAAFPQKAREVLEEI